MVSVDVGEANAGYLARRDPRVDHLALRALARIKKQALAVPAQEVAVMVPGPGGTWEAVPRTTSSRMVLRAKKQVPEVPVPALLDAAAA